MYRDMMTLTTTEAKSRLDTVEELVKVYISGPMRGIVNLNAPRFNAVTEVFRGWGAVVYNPAEWPADEMPADYIPRDTNWILKMKPGRDFMVLLPGWKESTGAMAEVGLAIWMGLDFCLWPEDEISEPIRVGREVVRLVEGPSVPKLQEGAPIWPGNFWGDVDKVRKSESIPDSTSDSRPVDDLPPCVNAVLVGIGEGMDHPAKSGQIRTFPSGATRDSDQDKLDYEGFLDPLVLQRFAEYMHKHRQMADGSLRSSDNWQKGIPFEQLMKSFIRHSMELWQVHRMKIYDWEPAKERDPGDIEEVLCAVIFNAQAMLRALIQDEHGGELN